MYRKRQEAEKPIGFSASLSVRIIAD